MKHHHAKEALDNVLQNPWWSRSWTLQEHVLAQEWAFLCGRIRIPSTLLALAVSEIRESGSFIVLFSSFSKRLLFSSEFSQRRSQASINKLTLELVTLPFHLETSKPVDKIYSIFSILKLLDIDLPEPDYRKSLEQVYGEVLVALIRAQQNLALMLYATRWPDTSALPSWVPDWRHPFTILIDMLSTIYVSPEDGRFDFTSACPPG